VNPYSPSNISYTRTQYHLPAEIVEAWEPVYEEEAIQIAGYTAERSEDQIKFGCQFIDKRDLEAVYNILTSSEMNAELRIRDEVVPASKVRKLLKMLN
jgi:hypothetical protein